MFHVNAWGMPYAGAMCGAKLVMPGPGLDGKNVYEIVRDEKVTLALGVPTVWLMLFNHVDTAKLNPKADLKLNRVVIGGSAAPRAMSERFETHFGAQVVHAWGMTEMSPLGTVCNFLPKHAGYTLDQRLDVQGKQGRPVYGVEMKITDDDGKRLPHDGKAFGHLMVRGPWITAGYFKGDGGEILETDGFFDTGDVATIDVDGYMQITDRSKDVIKSGGEWISSIDLENAAMGHPAVAEAAVIGVSHPKWQERPLLIVVKKKDQDATRDQILQYLEGQDSQVVAAGRCRFRRRPAAHGHGQAAEDEAARAIQELSVSDDLTGSKGFRGYKPHASSCGCKNGHRRHKRRCGDGYERTSEGRLARSGCGSWAGACHRGGSGRMGDRLRDRRTAVGLHGTGNALSTLRYARGRSIAPGTTALT